MLHDNQIKAAMVAKAAEAELPPDLLNRIKRASVGPQKGRWLVGVQQRMKRVTPRFELVAACLLLAGGLSIALYRNLNSHRAPAVGSTEANSVHTPIQPSDVVQIDISAAGSMKVATPDEGAKIIEWFNAGTDPRANKELAGTTPDVVITIRLRPGREVRILRSGQDFEVADEGPTGKKQYWLKQQDMRKFLNSYLSGGGDAAPPPPSTGS